MTRFAVQGCTRYSGRAVRSRGVRVRIGEIAAAVSVDAAAIVVVYNIVWFVNSRGGCARPIPMLWEKVGKEDILVLQVVS